MAKEFAEAFYKSELWQACRASFISKRRAVDGGMCQRCHEMPGYIVHHKVHLNPYNIMDDNITLNHDNLEFVCKPCHDIEHFVPKEKKLLCHFDNHGRPIQDGNAKECDEGHQT